ncbi:MAG: site-specific integrase [Acidimicrobiales bacterium]
MPAKAYRLLRAIMNTAVEDGLIARSPCVIKGAGAERSPERPVISVDEVFTIADAMPPRFRALVLLAAFSSLREGELFGLCRRHLDLLHGTVTVDQQAQTLRDGRVIVTIPKTDAGLRTVTLPAALVPELEAHLAAYAQPDGEALVFTGEKGAPLRRNHWSTTWRKAARRVGVPNLHFHDLRHAGNTMAAATGASTKELMARMGHSSPRAALIYQHATRERDAAIASALNEVLTSEDRTPSAPVVRLRPTRSSAR